MIYENTHKPRRRLLSFMEWLEQRDRQHEDTLVEVRETETSRRKPRTIMLRRKQHT